MKARLAAPLVARHAGNWLLGSFTLLFFVFLVAPIAIVVAVSFTPQTAVSFPYQGFSFRWYVRLVEYRPFVDSFFTSIYLAFYS